MAIRFLCSACSQPIEVDDEWAHKTVACPYCRNTVTAPGESTLEESQEIPTASPASTLGGPPPPPSKGNTMAVVAFVLSCFVLALMAGSCAVAGAHRYEFEKVEEEMRRHREETDSPFQAVSRFVEERGGTLPNWMVWIGFLQLAAVAGSLAALICAVLGLRQPARRPLAVGALIISGSILLFSCLGLVSM